VGIVSLGIQVCNGIVEYYAQWKDYGDNIQATLNQFKELQALFPSCRTAIEYLELVPEELLILLETQLQAYKAAILRLRKYLEKLSAQLPGAAAVPEMQPWRRLTTDGSNCYIHSGRALWAS
jgi:hypothetical protein